MSAHSALDLLYSYIDQEDGFQYDYFYISEVKDSERKNHIINVKSSLDHKKRIIGQCLLNKDISDKVNNRIVQVLTALLAFNNGVKELSNICVVRADNFEKYKNNDKRNLIIKYKNKEQYLFSNKVVSLLDYQFKLKPESTLQITDISQLRNTPHMQVDHETKLLPIAEWMTDSKLVSTKQELYYDNGQLHQEDFYEDNVRNGPSITYYLNGNTSIKTSYKDGQKHGLQEEFYESGNLESQISYEGGKSQGEVKEYYDNAKKSLKEKYFLQDGVINGDHIEYHENGKPAIKESYHNGLRHGLREEFYESGNLEGKYYHKDGKLTGDIETYYESGEKKIIVSLENDVIDDEFAHKTFSGTWKQFYENGWMLYESKYKNGQLHGEYTQYHENRNKHIEATYKNGKLDGKVTIYNLDGVKESEDLYKDGLMNGLRQDFYETGQIEKSINFTNGKADGTLTTYDEVGNHTLIAQYKNSLPDGKHWVFDENNIMKEIFHIKNEKNPDGNTELSREGESIIYYPNKKTELIFNVKDNKLNGLAKHYYENGNISCKGLFKNDEQDGLVVQYYPNGNIECKGIYKNGKADGTFITYDENDGSIIEQIKYKDGKKEDTSKYTTPSNIPEEIKKQTDSAQQLGGKRKHEFTNSIKCNVFIPLAKIKYKDSESKTVGEIKKLIVKELKALGLKVSKDYIRCGLIKNDYKKWYDETLLLDKKQQLAIKEIQKTFHSFDYEVAYEDILKAVFYIEYQDMQSNDTQTIYKWVNEEIKNLKNK